MALNLYSYVIHAGQDSVDHMPLHMGMAAAGAITTITLDGGASAANDFYNGWTVHIVHGPGAGQSARVSDYVGATKVATIDGRWSIVPTTSSRFIVSDQDGHNVVQCGNAERAMISLNCEAGTTSIVWKLMGLSAKGGTWSMIESFGSGGSLTVLVGHMKSELVTVAGYKAIALQLATRSGSDEIGSSWVTLVDRV